MRRIIALAVFLLACTPTTALAEDPVTLQVTADSYVRHNQPTTNFGTQTVLRAGYSFDREVRALIKFTSPADGTGVLKLSVERSNGHTTRVYVAGNNWTETGVTWNNQPVIGEEVATFTSGWDQIVEVEVPVVEGDNTFVIRKFVGTDPGPISANPDNEVSRLTSSEGLVTLRPELTVTPLPPPPPPPPACEGVNVAATENLTTVAAANPPGTTFCLAAGTFTITSSVVGQQGDLFVGAGRTQTFLVGNGVVQHLMTSSGGDDFEVRSLDISGAVGDETCNPNCGRAFKVSGIITLRDIRCHHNDNQCAGSGGGGVKMFDSECDNNGWGPAFNVNSSDRSGACIKKASSGMQIVEVRNSFIHHNGWAGVWCDFCSPDSVFIVVGNTITDNASKGVSYEVSGGYSANDYGLIADNIIQRNGLLDTRTISSGITCNSCADLTIEGNTFGGNMGNRAVGLVNARRGTWGDLQNILIRNNTLNGDTLPCTMVGVTCENNV